MHWIKKTVFGMLFALFLFIAFSILAEGGIQLFSAEFLGITGFLLILAMGAAETNLVTYS